MTEYDFLDERTRDALADMLEFATELRDLAERTDIEELFEERLAALGVERLLEMIGDAAARVPDHVRGRIDLPWKRIVGLRNRLIHAYDRTDPATLVAIIDEEVPRVVTQIEDHLRRARD